MDKPPHGFSLPQRKRPMLALPSVCALPHDEDDIAPTQLVPSPPPTPSSPRYSPGEVFVPATSSPDEGTPSTASTLPGSPNSDSFVLYQPNDRLHTPSPSSLPSRTCVRCREPCKQGTRFFIQGRGVDAQAIHNECLEQFDSDLTLVGWGRSV